MEEAYLKASGNGTLPANARQIMYATRGKILELTGLKKFKDSYFTQVLLPDYMTEYDDETEDWDVVYDSRGALTEPHTGLRVALGTIAVRVSTSASVHLSDRPCRSTQMRSIRPRD